MMPISLIVLLPAGLAAYRSIDGLLGFEVAILSA